jgi:hypothetical protein
MTLFDFLPVLGTYRLTYYRSVVLRAPPTVLRWCTIAEVCMVLVVFALTYYYTATTATTETVVGFESRGSPYVCSLLSPRSDSVSLSKATSELVAFSDARFDLATCNFALSSAGYGVCSDDHRTDYLLSLGSLGTKGSVCIDIPLQNNYRFCTGNETEKAFQTREQELQFHNQLRPVFTYDEGLFFMNTSGKVSYLGSLPNPTNTLLSDYVSDFDSTVFLIQKDFPEAVLYSFHPGFSAPKKLGSIGSTNIYGVAYGNDAVFTLTMESTSTVGTANVFIGVHDLTTGTTKSGTQIQGCSGFFDSTVVPDASTRFISYGTDNRLYVLCTPSQHPSVGEIHFVSVDPVTFSTVSYTIPRSALAKNYTTATGANSGKAITTISQVFRAGNLIYLTSGSSFPNLLVADLSIPPNSARTLRSVTNLGFFRGSHGILNPNDKAIYFSGATNLNSTYYNTISRKFLDHYSLAKKDNYLMPTFIQLGFSYQICNGAYTNYTIDASISGSYRSACGKKNG